MLIDPFLADAVQSKVTTIYLGPVFPPQIKLAVIFDYVISD